MSVEPAQFSVAHLDADAFYVSIELRRHPELRGKPVVVAGSGPRAVVTTASYEARRFGVGSAMPAARARRLCPEAVVLPPDFATYREASREVMDIVRAHVERVEVVGLDEAYLDLTGLYSPRAAMRRLLAEIRAATELTCSVGIGPNKLVAKVASDAEKPAGFVVLTREQACARFAQAAARARARHRAEDRGAPGRAGVDHARRPSAPHPSSVLVERFGPNLGRELRRRARFEHDGEVGAARKVVSESRERTFDEDVRDPSALREALAADVRRAVREPRSRTGAAAARSGSRSASMTSPTVTRAHTVSEPTCDVEQVTAVALRLLEEYAPARPVRLLGVRVAGLSSAAAAGSPSRSRRGALGVPRPPAPLAVTKLSWISCQLPV